VAQGKVKVFYLINSMAQGGAERQMAEIIARLPKDRFEPVLCLLEDKNSYSYLLPDDQPRYILKEKGLRALLTVRRWLENERPDIVHSFMEWANLLARICSPFSKRPVVVTSVRGPLMAIRYRMVEALLSKFCDAIVVNSVAIKNELVRWQRVDPSKIKIIRNIVSLDRFKVVTEEERAKIRNELGLTGTVFLFPGRIAHEKNQLELVYAVYRLKKKGLLPKDCVFLLAGRKEQPYGHVVESSIRFFGVEDRVHYLGEYKDIERLYAACDWVVIPSFIEGMCNAALEAHTMARPLIMSKTANPDGIMLDGVTGYEFSVFSIPAFEQVILKAVSTKEAERRRMGMAGRERVLGMFNPNNVFQNLLDLYESLLARRNMFAR
jgi:glycosyltransferase involved in cell wall biosynthesis